MGTRPNLEQEAHTVIVIGYREGDHEVAYCLDLNLAAQGNSPEEALANLNETIRFHLRTAQEEGKEFADLLQGAPLSIKWKATQILIGVVLNHFHRGVARGCSYVLTRLRENDPNPLQLVHA